MCSCVVRCVLCVLLCCVCSCAVCAPVYSYYQKVPAELPKLPEKQIYGLATPNDFSLPPHDPLWTEELYKALEVKEHNAAEAAGPAVDKSEITPVLEPDVAPAKLPEPKTSSGCVIQ